MGDITIDEQSEGALEFYVKLFRSGVYLRNEQTGEIIFLKRGRPFHDYSRASVGTTFSLCLKCSSRRCKTRASSRRVISPFTTFR